MIASLYHRHITYSWPNLSPHDCQEVYKMFHTSLATWWSSASTIPMIRGSWPLNWCAKLQTLCIYKTKGKANSFFQMQLHNLMMFYQICLSWHCYDAKLLCLFWYVPCRETKKALTLFRPSLKQTGPWVSEHDTCQTVPPQKKKKPICHACYRSVLYNWHFTFYSNTSGAWM